MTWHLLNIWSNFYDSIECNNSCFSSKGDDMNIGERMRRRKCRMYRRLNMIILCKKEHTNQALSWFCNKMNRIMPLTCRHTVPFQLCIITHSDRSIFRNISMCLIKYHYCTSLVIDESIWALEIKRNRGHVIIVREKQIGSSDHSDLTPWSYLGKEFFVYHLQASLQYHNHRWWCSQLPLEERQNFLIMLAWELSVQEMTRCLWAHRKYQLYQVERWVFGNKDKKIYYKFS